MVFGHLHETPYSKSKYRTERFGHCTKRPHRRQAFPCPMNCSPAPLSVRFFHRCSTMRTAVLLLTSRWSISRRARTPRTPGVRSLRRSPSCRPAQAHVDTRRPAPENTRLSVRGGVPKRPTGADCKSAGSCLRRFESYPLHQVSRRETRRKRGLRTGPASAAGVVQW